MRAWIEQHVTVTGEIEQPHVRIWATALRVPTSDGVLWFKAGRDAFAHEARVLELIGPLAPDLLPELVAVRAGEGWILMRDGGDRAREHPIEWAPLMRRYAVLQIATAPLVDRLLAAGALDTRAPSVAKLLPWLTPPTASRLHERLPEVEERLARLAGSPLPFALDHGDLHDGNVFVRDGHVRILDWGDAAVAHPFSTLTVEEDPAARDAYLEPWEAYAPRGRLLADVADVLALRFLLRAINWDRVVSYDPAWAPEIEKRVLLFLDEPGSSS